MASGISPVWMDRLLLEPGIQRLRAVFQFRPAVYAKPMLLTECSLVFPEATLAIETVQGGAMGLQESWPRCELIHKLGHDLFRRADQFQRKALIDTSSTRDVTALTVTETALTQLLDPALAEQLLACLGLYTSPVVRVLPIPIQISALLQAALSTHLQGPLKKLFAQAKVLEYLCALAALVMAPEPMPRRLPRKRDRAREHHDYLIQLEGKLPNLDELAVRFGISVRRLNEEFAQEYGLPIYAFISEWRLNAAYVAIHDSNIALKTLAERLGYAHVNHFNAAFKKQFGYPPGQLRRSERTL